MITFLLAIAFLIVGYLIYGKIVDKFFGADPQRVTPAIEKADGVDFKVLPTWKIFVIQFLNIAGLGPIFGAVMGAAYGPIAYLWIAIGCVFMGAVQDYFSGMLSIRNGGLNMPDLIGKYLGNGIKKVMSLVIPFLLLAVGVSFVTGPADLLESLSSMDKDIWLYIIFGYYVIATLLPIDKIIGNLYPIFGATLLFMALGVGIALIYNDATGAVSIPNLTFDSFQNYHRDPANNIVIPMLFVVISCGAISGFHSTQSPLMARCLKSEKHARPVFYGAMIAEGIVAMIWATAAMAYFGGPEGLNAAGVTPAIAVDMICESWLGKVGAVLAVLGVIVCPITSGDTAFRSLRLTLADLFKMDQKPIMKRIIISLPIFALAFFFCHVEFATLWKYVGIGNQILATIMMWTATSYLLKMKKPHWMCSIPATFLTYVCVCFFMVAPVKNGGLHLAPIIGHIVGVTVALSLFFFIINRKHYR